MSCNSMGEAPTERHQLLSYVTGSHRPNGRYSSDAF